MIALRKLRELTAEQRAAVLARPAILDEETLAGAKKILDDVRENGDEAVRRYTKKFDKVDLESLEAAPKEVAAAEGRVPQQVQVALRSMYESVMRFHKNGVLKPFEIQPIKGVTLGKMIVPFERAGLYIPGGSAVYPSSLIMAAAPATVAGVRHLTLCSPPMPDGSLPDTILFTAKLCGIEKIFRIGGAQAVAAMAYGTASVARCDIIAGPGNRWVTAAKKLVSGDVAIDFLAGPTEILIVSDGDVSAKFVAADLIAQAEHDPAACSILVTPKEAHAQAVLAEIEAQVPGHARREIIERALKNGALLVTDSMDQAIEFANEYAAEHLVLASKAPTTLLKSIRSAGSVFLGEYSPVAIGDYGAGPNAILPTLGEAKRVSGLTANSFLKTISYQMLSPEGLAGIAPTAVALARVENLGAHQKSIEIRLDKHGT